MEELDVIVEFHEGGFCRAGGRLDLAIVDEPIFVIDDDRAEGEIRSPSDIEISIDAEEDQIVRDRHQVRKRYGERADAAGVHKVAQLFCAI